VLDLALEQANGRMWSIESAANTFSGPPIGSLLLLVAFAAPFFVDSVTFFVAAALVALVPGSFRVEHPERPDGGRGPSRKTHLKDGRGRLTCICFWVGNFPASETHRPQIRRCCLLFEVWGR